MTGRHTQQLCDSFSALASEGKGHFAQHSRLLNGPASMDRSTGGKPFGKNHPLALRILAPEAADHYPPTDPLPRTRQVCEGTYIVRVYPGSRMPTDWAIDFCGSRSSRSCDHFGSLIDFNTGQSKYGGIGEQ